jgi:glycosyltransferase involved in cell wall biosynthesis
LEVEKACLETAETIVATSPQEKAHMRQFMSEKGKIEIIPCGTDIRRFGAVSGAKARLKLGIPKSSLMVLYVGRFDQRKGVETLVRALGKSIFPGIADIRLVLVGGWRDGQSDGAEKARLEGIVKELGLEQYVTFAGQKSHEELPLYYSAANVCVVPSHYEPFGLVAIEAMASRTPVVASDVGGLKYTVVSEKTGLLCPAKDEVVFAKAIDRILTDHQWQHQLGEAARHRVESQFSWHGVASQLDSLYTSLTETPVALSA